MFPQGKRNVMNLNIVNTMKKFVFELYIMYTENRLVLFKLLVS